MSEVYNRIYLERDDGTIQFEIDRKTRPHIAQVLSAYGQRWEVYYIEDRGGKTYARANRYTPL